MQGNRAGTATSQILNTTLLRASLGTYFSKKISIFLKKISLFSLGKIKIP
jgi:hypothetical protein